MVDRPRLNRLTVMGESVLGGGSGGGSWTESNMYDRWGNRWALNSGSQSFLTPAESGWIESSTNRVTVARVTPTALGTVSYYAGGQLKSHPSVGAMLKWDVESQLRSVDVAQYFYDGEGQRIRKEVGGVTTYYALDGMGKLGAEYGGTPGSGGVRYLTVDHLGSTRVVTDGFGMVKARCDYSAFGEVLMGTAGVGNRNAIGEYGCGDGGVNQKFTSKERDQETGLDYFGARYLSGGMGRFVSADEYPGGLFDPLTGQQVAAPGLLPYADIYDPQTINKYAYVRNNPLRYTDPDGHCVSVLTPYCPQMISAGQQGQRVVGHVITGAGIAVSTGFAAFAASNASGQLGSIDMHGGPDAQALSDSQTQSTQNDGNKSANSRDTPSKADYVVSTGGTAVPVDKGNLESGLKGAGVSSRPNTQPKEGGTVYDVNTANWTMPVRVMPGNSKNPPRLVMGTKESPRNPDGKRPSRGKERDESHIVLK